MIKKEGTLNNLEIRSYSVLHLIYSSLQRLEGNESPMFVDVSGCVAAAAHRNVSGEVLEGNESPVFVEVSGCVADVAHRNFHSEVEHSNLCQTAFVLIDIDFVLVSICSVDKKT